MKISIFSSLLIVNILGVTAVDTIEQDVANIPECSFAELKKALKSENCGSTDVECMCGHLDAIAGAVIPNVEHQCGLDFAQSFGSMCGIWAIFDSTASHYAEATSILAKDLDGDSSEPSATKKAVDSTTSATQSSAIESSAPESAATESAATPSASVSTAGATTTSSNLAAMPTVNKMMAGFVGLVGGAAALGGGLI
ncbi:hypothetical protein BGZ63DRAFT_466455 [Mariannaea sp. PMI_226]|nr:hypothetical protein BGZ63DRAFT_466455 [Mariannaea sp. PMI_226]